MSKLKNYELKEIVGGIKFSAAFLNNIIKGVNLLLELGRSVGTALRRSLTKNYCK